MAKTASCDIAPVITGKIKPTNQEPTQFMDEAIPEARPRMESGKISPTITQVNGAQVKE